MCVAPNTLANGTTTACRKCWQCVERAINDWVGRNIAESKTAIACHAVTLTYGRSRAGDADHERANVLTYSDVQKYLKLLRRHGYPVRYFVTGEFGSKKGRAHWHIMLYWLERVPEHELDANFMERHWPHGWSFWTKPNAHAIRYNCKYIQKEMGDDQRQGHLAMSKKPPLGDEYFRRLANKLVEQGLAPQTLEYTFPEVTRLKRDTGQHEVVTFMLKDVPADRFLDYYLAAWDMHRPDQPVPRSRLIDEWLFPERKEIRHIEEWLAELPPIEHWTVAQGLQANEFFNRLDELRDPDDTGHSLKPFTGPRATPEDNEAHLRRVRLANKLADMPKQWGYDPVDVTDDDGQTRTVWIKRLRRRGNG